MFWQVVIVAIVLIPILAIVLDSQFGKAIARRLERPRLPAGDESSHERLAFLETEVERLGSEVARLDEENRFFQKLLAERTPGPGEEPPGDRTSSRDQAT